MSKRKLFEEAVKKLGKPKDFPKTNFKKAFDDYDKQIKRKKDKKSNFEKAFDDYDKQIKRKKNIKEIKKAAVPAALGTAGGTAGGTYAAKNKKKAGGAIKAMKKIKDNAGSITLIGASGGGYPLSKKIQEEGRKAKAKAKNKKKGMKAGGIVDRQYLKGR